MSNVLGSVEAELLAVKVLGAKELIEKEATGTIPSGETSTGTVNVHSGDFIVIKNIEVSGVTPSKIILTVDGKSMNLTKTGDLETNYGAKVGGKKIDVEVQVGSAVGSETSVTIKIYGYKPK